MPASHMLSPSYVLSVTEVAVETAAEWPWGASHLPSLATLQVPSLAGPQASHLGPEGAVGVPVPSPCRTAVRVRMRWLWK